MLIYVYTRVHDDGPQTQDVLVDGSESGGTQVIIDRGPHGTITGIEIVDGGRTTVEAVPTE